MKKRTGTASAIHSSTCVTVPSEERCLLPKLTSGAGIRMRSVTGHRLGLNPEALALAVP